MSSIRPHFIKWDTPGDYRWYWPSGVIYAYGRIVAGGGGAYFHGRSSTDPSYTFATGGGGGTGLLSETYITRGTEEYLDVHIGDGGKFGTSIPGDPDGGISGLSGRGGDESTITQGDAVVCRAAGGGGAFLDNTTGQGQPGEGVGAGDSIGYVRGGGAGGRSGTNGGSNDSMNGGGGASGPSYYEDGLPGDYGADGGKGGAAVTRYGKGGDGAYNKDGEIGGWPGAGGGGSGSDIPDTSFKAGKGGHGRGFLSWGDPLPGHTKFSGSCCCIVPSANPVNCADCFIPFVNAAHNKTRYPQRALILVSGLVNDTEYYDPPGNEYTDPNTIDCGFCACFNGSWLANFLGSTAASGGGGFSFPGGPWAWSWPLPTPAEGPFSFGGSDAPRMTPIIPEPTEPPYWLDKCVSLWDDPTWRRCPAQRWGYTNPENAPYSDMICVPYDYAAAEEAYPEGPLGHLNNIPKAVGLNVPKYSGSVFSTNYATMSVTGERQIGGSLWDVGFSVQALLPNWFMLNGPCGESAAMVLPDSLDFTPFSGSFTGYPYQIGEHCKCSDTATMKAIFLDWVERPFV